MRILFVTSYLANIALALASLYLLPTRIAVHFGVGGMPDNCAPCWVYVLMMIALHSLLFAGIVLSPRLLGKAPAWMVNLPNKQYWLRDENRPRAAAMATRLMWQFGTALFVFIFVAGVLALQANRRAPVQLNERLFLVGLGLFLAHTACWLVQLYRTFRLPQA